MNKIYIDTMGCPKNQEDSERVAGLLVAADREFEIVPSPGDADVMIINTCGFIDEAKRESIDRILELIEFKNADSNKKIIATGCLTQRYGDDILKEFNEIDAVLGVNDYQELPEIINDLFSDEDTERTLRIDGKPGFLDSGRRLLNAPYSAYLKIAEGCSNNCSYCVIPMIRGPYRSVKTEDIISDAKNLAKNGAKELILIAQDVTAYGIDIYGKYALPCLLKKLCEIDGIKWIRMLYCYEDKITDELIDVMATEDKICKYIDIPLQHISEGILHMMNRSSDPGHIKNTIKKLRDRIPEISIRTTFITGFPGEMEEDFKELKKFIEDVKFDRLGAFCYSREEGTEAASMDEQIPAEVANGRRDDIMRIQMDISFKKNEKMIGNIYDVIVDDVDGDGVLYGRTQFDAPEIDNAVIINTDLDINIGDFVKARITDAYDYDFIGEIE